jgi:hypothetical protein
MIKHIKNNLLLYPYIYHLCHSYSSLLVNQLLSAETAAHVCLPRLNIEYILLLLTAKVWRQVL